MLSPKKTYAFLAAFLTVLAPSSGAGAALYGFSNVNPYTPEEEILKIDYLPTNIRNYRQEMRDNLLMLIDFAKKQNPDFKIITHEGQELLTKSLWEYNLDGYNRARRYKINAEDPAFLFHREYEDREPEENTEAYRYLHLVDAVALNNLYCGTGKENAVTRKHRLGLITVESCPTEEAFDRAIVSSVLDKKMIYGFTDADKAFKNILNQPVINDSAQNVQEVADAKNILLAIDDSAYNDKDAFVNDLLKTNYDIIIMQPLFRHRQRFSPEDIRSLQFKKNGSRRLLIASMNVSEANPRDYFWNPKWKIGSPSWLVRPSFVEKDSVIAAYWDSNWQKIISRHFKDIVATGFDGVFFTGIENHQYFEHLTPLE